MIEQDNAFVEKRRLFYENHYRGSEQIDPWHAHAQSIVHATAKKWFYEFGMRRAGKVLNAGSGGSDYGIKAPMVHLDLTSEHIACFPEFIIGDIANIKVSDASFAIILCVGSVLNYGNPILAIQEFQRVLSPGGLLILEYERSGSFEYWRKHGPSSPCVRVNTFYGGVKTELWAYGDGFVDGILTLNGFKTIAESRFHAVTSLALAATGSPRIANYFSVGDQFLANLWPIRYVASNRILAVEKPTH